MGSSLERFEQLWAVDFEFIARPGERPEPVCLVAKELRSNKKIGLWRDQFSKEPPYPCNDRTALFIAYFASAEFGCHLALGWPLPVRVLDLFSEFRNLTNGRKTIAGNSLLGALAYFGQDTIGAEEKEEMRELILSGGPWDDQQKKAILDYCESDIDALERLLSELLPYVDLPRALLRGRYMAAVACMERVGTPIDTGIFHRLTENWETIQDRLIGPVDKDFGIYEGRSFRQDRFEAYLCRQGIGWPRLENGQLDLERQTFRDMVKLYPSLSPIHELRYTLAEMRLHELTIGSDGYNRTLLSPFGARTGRNTPSNSKSVFGPATWIRSLIKPAKGTALAYVDWCQQEFGIAAVLSGDPAMLEAYTSGDPYLAFACQAGAVPEGATKETHGQVRDLFKTCALAVQYGMGKESLAARIGQLPVVARRLLEFHREVYRRFWDWSDAVVDHAMFYGWQQSLFGWSRFVFPEPRGASLRNFPMQANGAEMLRLACCLGTEVGIQICAPVHDAVLIVAQAERLEEDVMTMRACMAEASRVVLAGFELRTEVKPVHYPERYSDKRGEAMFRHVMKLL
jgi:DNA polymerase I